MCATHMCATHMRSRSHKTCVNKGVGSLDKGPTHMCERRWRRCVCATKVAAVRTKPNMCEQPPPPTHYQATQPSRRRAKRALWGDGRRAPISVCVWCSTLSTNNAPSASVNKGQRRLFAPIFCAASSRRLFTSFIRFGVLPVAYHELTARRCEFRRSPLGSRHRAWAQVIERPFFHEELEDFPTVGD